MTAPLRVLVCGGREDRFILALSVWAIALTVARACTTDDLPPMAWVAGLGGLATLAVMGRHLGWLHDRGEP
jgi:hypothetical protein